MRSEEIQDERLREVLRQIKFKRKEILRLNGEISLLEKQLIFLSAMPMSQVQEVKNESH